MQFSCQYCNIRHGLAPELRIQSYDCSFDAEVGPNSQSERNNSLYTLNAQQFNCDEGRHGTMLVQYLRREFLIVE